MAAWEGGEGFITPGFFFINSEKRMDSTGTLCYVMLKKLTAELQDVRKERIEYRELGNKLAGQEKKGKLED